MTINRPGIESALDAFAHGGMNRRGFLQHLAKLGVSAAIADLSLGTIAGLSVDTDALLAFDSDSGRRIGSADERLGE